MSFKKVLPWVAGGAAAAGGLFYFIKRKEEIERVKKVKILFICKQNNNYGWSMPDGKPRKGSGLYNSTQFIVEGLKNKGVDAKIVEVFDNNDIDREVTQFKADIVVIEAVWVVPEKFTVLKRLHPRVKWFIHLHSNMPFLAQEGNAIDWCFDYERAGIKLIANSEPSYLALKGVLNHPKDLFFLPNVYIMKPGADAAKNHDHHIHHMHKHEINIACFGAVRPLKNQLLQAMAAIEYAKEHKLKLRFHMNGSRVEVGGETVMKNIRALFAHTPNTDLILHGWHDPSDFIRQLEMKIDLGMQVSLTETFNVVTADYVTAGLPIVVSKEVYWADHASMAKDDEVGDMIDKMKVALGTKKAKLIALNKKHLADHSKHAQDAWYKFVKHESKAKD